MQRRFTVIQGGLSAEPATVAPADAMRAERWRVALQSARDIADTEIAAWRALAEWQAAPDPFTDPDFLLTAARHATDAIVIALAYAEFDDGRSTLAGVLPLTLPHPLRGGPARLWQPPLAPRPVEPLFAAASAPAATEAVIRHLQERRSRCGLHLTRLAADARILRALEADARLLCVRRLDPAPVPATSIVAIGPRRPATETESITAPAGIRDAVERFLLADARASARPILDNPAAAATVRVATRLFARRSAVRVELGLHRGTIVSGALWLGRPDRAVLWRSTAPCADIPSPGTANLELTLADAAGSETRPAHLRLVAGS